MVTSLNGVLPRRWILLAVIRDDHSDLLYDLDLIINRTLVYGSLTILLGATFYGSAVTSSPARSAPPTNILGACVKICPSVDAGHPYASPPLAWLWRNVHLHPGV